MRGDGEAALDSASTASEVAEVNSQPDAERDAALLQRTKHVLADRATGWLKDAIFAAPGHRPVRLKLEEVRNFCCWREDTGRWEPLYSGMNKWDNVKQFLKDVEKTHRVKRRLNAGKVITSRSSNLYDVAAILVARYPSPSMTQLRRSAMRMSFHIALNFMDMSKHMGTE